MNEIVNKLLTDQSSVQKTSQILGSVEGSFTIYLTIWRSECDDKYIVMQAKESNEYSKVAGYKINTQKSLAFIYTNNEKIEREIKETIPFTIATKRIKYLGINIPKETKYLYIQRTIKH